MPIDQLELAFEEVQQEAPAEGAGEEARHPERRIEPAAKRRSNRGVLPEHLPWIETVVDVEDKACPCCAGALRLIGEDRTERLDIVPSQLRVLVMRRPKYACRACDDVVVQAPAPARLIEGGIPPESTVAHVVVSNYADHLPLYRPSPDLRPPGGSGLIAPPWRTGPPRSLPAAAGARAPTADAPKIPQALRQRDRGPGARSRTRPHQDRSALGLCPRRPPVGGADPPAVTYVYAPDLKAERRMAHLASYSGVLQVDRFGGCRPLAESGHVQLAFCWADVRGRLYDLAAAGPAPITERGPRSAQGALRRGDRDLRA